MSGQRDPISSPQPTAAYPRGDHSGDNLRKTAEGMKLVNSAAIVWLCLSFACPVIALGGTGTAPIPPHSSRDYLIGRLLGEIFISSTIPNLITSILLFLGLKVVGEALRWKKATAYLVPLGSLLTSCMCGGAFFYVGIIVLVNQQLARLGAPNWSSLSPQKLIAYANSGRNSPII